MKKNGLFLDLTTNQIIIGITANMQVIDLIKINTNKNMIEIVIKQIDQLIKKNNLSKNDIKTFYWVSGPGLFTGMRCASLIIKSWSLFQAIEIYEINKLFFQSTYNCISLIDAQGNKYFYNIYIDNKCVEKNKIIAKDELCLLQKQYPNLNFIIDYQYNIDDINSKLPFFQLIDVNKIELEYLKEAC